MLEYLGRQAEAGIVMRALEAVHVSGPRTRDLGGTDGTRDVGDAVVAQVALLVNDGPVEPQNRPTVLV